jgi:hypothetical protein
VDCKCITVINFKKIYTCFFTSFFAL